MAKKIYIMCAPAAARTRRRAPRRATRRALRSRALLVGTLRDSRTHAPRTAPVCATRRSYYSTYGHVAALAKKARAPAASHAR
jgi:hypothetical protein